MKELEDISQRDQRDAAVADISKAVARHFATLTDAGMSSRYAISLCRHMQDQWLIAVLPASDLVREMMAGHEEIG